MQQYRPIEQRMIDDKARMLAGMGMSLAEARATAVAEMDRAIAVAKERGRYGCGPLGDWMLGNPDYSAYFAWAYEHYAVRPEDVHVWWDMDEVERAMAEIDDEMARMGVFLSARRKGLTPEAAGAKLWEILPYFDFDFGRQSESKDLSQLLPAELKPRVVSYVEQCMRRRTPPATDGFATFNDWVRFAISQGIL